MSLRIAVEFLTARSSGMLNSETWTKSLIADHAPNKDRGHPGIVTHLILFSYPFNYLG